MSEPLWLTGGDAVLPVAPDAPVAWWLSLGEPETRARADAVPSLPGEATSFARHRDAGERALRQRLTRLLLATATGCRATEVIVKRNDGNAPVVVIPAGWHLSLAARWPHFVIGIARRPIGVDIEQAGAPLPPDLLTEAERASPRLADAARWAAKEAHAKWTAHPRSLEPSAIETADVPLVRSRYGTTRCWLRERDGHVAALCTA